MVRCKDEDVEAGDSCEQRVETQGGLWVLLFLCVDDQGGGVEGEENAVFGADTDFVVALWFRLGLVGSVDVVLLVLDIKLFEVA